MKSVSCANPPAPRSNQVMAVSCSDRFTATSSGQGAMTTVLDSWASSPLHRGTFSAEKLLAFHSQAGEVRCIRLLPPYEPIENVYVNYPASTATNGCEGATGPPGSRFSPLSELARFGTVAHRNRRDLGAGVARAVGEKPLEPRGRRAGRRLQAAA